MGRRWDALLEVYDRVESDPTWTHLRRPGIRLVPGDGPESAETARVMVVGEAPGAQENGAGRPFIGPSGKVLDQLLEVIGLTRVDTFVTNVLKYRPQGNRTPVYREIHEGIATLREEWSIIKPILTIAVGSLAQCLAATAREHHLRQYRQLKGGHVPGSGGLAAQAALAQYRPIHGCLSPFGDGWITSVYHPAFGLRQKKARTWIESEWERLREELVASEILEQIGAAS